MDDCSIDNVKEYFEVIPTVKVDKKTRYSFTYYEIKILYKHFEFLVTEALYVNSGTTEFDEFPGSSRFPPSFYVVSNWILLTPRKKVSATCRPKLLQNFRRSASLFAWSFKSQHFMNLKFETSHPLTLTKKKCKHYQHSYFLHISLWFSWCNHQKLDQKVQNYVEAGHTKYA